MILKSQGTTTTDTSSFGGGAAEVGATPAGLPGMGTRRTTVSLTDLRTPLVENIMSMLPMGHDKALKYALYNVLAMILAAVCVIAIWAAYCILEPFIVPLLWALLCGSVIHPFKDRLVSFTREWILMVKASTTPLSLQLVSIPFRAVDSVSESIGGRVITWWKYILVGSGGFFLTYVIYHNPPVTLGWILYWSAVFVVNFFFYVVSWINGQLVMAVTVVYLGAIFHFVYGAGSIPLTPMEPETPEQALQQDKNPGMEKQKEPSELKRTGIGDADADAPQAPLPKVPLTSTKAAKTDTKLLSRERWLLRVLSVAAWAMWFIYICRLLPYPLLLMVLTSMGTGVVVFVRKYSLRRPVNGVTVFAAIISLIPGVEGLSSRGASRKGSAMLVTTRRNTMNLNLNKTPSPAATNASITVGVGSPSVAMKTMKHDLDLKISGEEGKIENATTDASSASLLQYCCSDESFASHTQPVDAEDEVDGLLESNTFLYGVFCACLVVQVWNRFWLVNLLPFPVVYYGLKRAYLWYAHDYLYKKVFVPLQNFYSCPGANSHSHDIFPRSIRIFVDVVYEADKKTISVFESYLDMVASIFIIVAVMVVSVIFLIFVATQFYAEGDHLVRVGANVINTTVSQYPEISQLLPEGWESLTGSLVGNAYHYGRDYIKTMIRDSVAEKNPEKAEEMEKQVIELWDRIYMSWNRTWAGLDEVGGPGRITAEGMTLEWNDIVKTGQNVTDWFDTTMLVTYAKSNYGQLRAVLESVWTVLIGNVSLAISAITSVFSVLFGGGSALLNLIVSFVVFFTALFYLLSASTSDYKPVELFNLWFPGDGKHSSNFVAAIEESVSGVFSATLKMSAFYGMWTWLIHTLFQVNIVFVPSFFAAIFAAVPLLMPYWAVFPAVLELWLIQGQWTKALLMLLAQMAPMSLVDAQIYSEIKGGGHPYLTALAVAGGIFYFGFQGAIMGPVVLCFLFVAAKVGSTYMKEGALDD